MKRRSSACRRQFLRGAGGFSLALPFLPSLATRRASAQVPVVPRDPHLYWLATQHGGVFESSMFPNPSLLTQTQALYSDHAIRYGNLTTAQPGVLCDVLSGAALSNRLIGKMNVLHGIDVPFYLGHHTGGHLGNYARNDGNGNDGKAVQASPRPTIDQIAAWSPSFYPSLNGIRERVMVMGAGGMSYNYADPAMASGNIQQFAPSTSSVTLFNQIFVAPTSGPPVAMRTLIVDRVVENYRNLRNSNRRLSGADKQRLDAHLGMLAELQRRLNDVTAPSSGCNDVQKPTHDAQQYINGNAPMNLEQYGKLFNDVVVAAFACGSSRIGTFLLNQESKAVSYTGDWHQEVAHQWSSPTAQTNLRTAYQFVFEKIYLDLATKLDGYEVAPGRTLLDDTLMSWTQECDMETHMQVSVPVVTFGSAAGYFRTGMFVDYQRNGVAASAYKPGGAPNTQYMGVNYMQWLATVLQSMRVPPSEFERWGHKGYGVPYVTPESWMPAAMKSHYQNTSSRYFTDASKPLPVITG